MTQRPARNWQILRVSHRYIIGEDGLPILNDTDALICALEPLESIQYVFDTNELRVEGVRGCVAGPVTQDEYEPDEYWAVALTLDTPLGEGETAALMYRTFFHYSDSPPNELVQGGTARGVGMVNLIVEFHQAKKPTRVWWERRDQKGIVSEYGPLEIIPNSQSPAAGGYVSHEMTNLQPQHLLLVRWE